MSLADQRFKMETRRSVEKERIEVVDEGKNKFLKFLVSSREFGYFSRIARITLNIEGVKFAKISQLRPIELNTEPHACVTGHFPNEVRD